MAGEINIQLLPYGPRCFSWTSLLYAHCFNKVGDTTRVLDLISVAGQVVDLNCDGGVRFLLLKEAESES